MSICRSDGKTVMRAFAELLAENHELDAVTRRDIYNTLSIAMAEDPRHERCLYMAALSVENARNVNRAQDARDRSMFPGINR